MTDIDWKEADVLAVGAHPDDVEMGMGGTVAALTAAGHRVALVSLTAGELGTYGDPATRARESAAAAAILGCTTQILDLPDGGVQDDLAGRHLMVRILRQVRPRLVFAPYPYSRSGPWDGRSNVDHLATGSLVLAAAKLARMRSLMPERPPHGVQKVYSYMVPEGVMPSFVVDVTPHRDTLRQAIEAYASQMSIRRGDRSVMDFLMLFRQTAGYRIRAELGEAFVSDDPLGGDATQLLELR